MLVEAGNCSWLHVGHLSLKLSVGKTRDLFAGFLVQVMPGACRFGPLRHLPGLWGWGSG